MTYVLEDWVGTNGWELWGLGGPSAVTLTRCSSEKSAIPGDPPAGWENGQWLTEENVGRRNMKIYN